MATDVGKLVFKRQRRAEAVLADGGVLRMATDVGKLVFQAATPRRGGGSPSFAG